MFRTVRLIETIPDERHVVANDRIGEINRKFGIHASVILCFSERKRMSYVGKLLELEHD